MQRNYIFIVIFAILGNTATGKKWRNHHVHTHDCHHHYDEWNTHGESTSSNDDAYDWPFYSEYDSNRHHPWGSGNHHQHKPYPNYDWGSGTDDLSSTIVQRSTPFPTDSTVTNPETQFIQTSDTTVFPSPSSIDSSSPTSSSPTTLSPETQTEVTACLRSCLVTPEYQPVCGTDYQTYNNMGRLVCAQNCGVDVRVFLRRTCPSLSMGVLRFTRVDCISTCPITEEKNPVCGSDDVTYDNPSQLLCAQMCGYNVMLKSMTPCSEVTTSQPTNFLKTQSIPYGVRLCLQACPTVDEFKPVCGTNDVTYENPSHLDCARICGIDVDIKQRFPCGQTDNNANRPSIPSVDDQRVSPLPPTVQMCVNSCPVTADFSPVCGTNGITYTNPSQLQCDQQCGIRVNILQQSACPPNTNNNGDNFNNNQITSTSPTSTTTTLSPEVCIRSCPQTPEYNPVCGTNGVTYKNPSHLSCAQSCGVRVDLQRRSPCPTIVIEPPITSQPARPITNPPLLITTTTNAQNNGGVNVVMNPSTTLTDVNNGKPLPDKDATTISDALLLSIFPDVTTIKTTSTTEPDEEVDFDTRFGEDEV